MNEFVYIEVEWKSGKIDMFYVHQSSVETAVEFFENLNSGNPAINVTVIE